MNIGQTGNAARYVTFPQANFLYRSCASPDQAEPAEMEGPITVLCRSDTFPAADIANFQEGAPGFVTVSAPEDCQTQLPPDSRPEKAEMICHNTNAALPKTKFPDASEEDGTDYTEETGSRPGGNQNGEVPGIETDSIHMRSCCGSRTVPVVLSNGSFEIWNYAPSDPPEKAAAEECDGFLHMNGPYLQVMYSAQKALDMFSGSSTALKWKDPLPIIIGHPQAEGCLPFYQTAPFKAITADRTDYSVHPDFISHEIGHAILDGLHRYDCKDFNTAAAHEAFADCTAAAAAWQEPAVLADMLRQKALGLYSNRATALGEHCGSFRKDRPVRDLAQPEIPPPSPASGNAHGCSQQFSSAFCTCLWMLDAALKNAGRSVRQKIETAEIPPELEAQLESLPSGRRDFRYLQAAAAILNRHLVHLPEHLPSTPHLTMRSLYQALLKAAAVDSSCPLKASALYQQCFSGSQLEF